MSIKLIFFKLLDIICFPITVISAVWLKLLTTVGLHKTAVGQKTLLFFGILPIRDHYYQPLINPKKHLKSSLRADRFLPGIEMNIARQLEILQSFDYNDELLALPVNNQGSESTFYYNNGSFEAGDAEYLYNIIRAFKPSKVIEIGSGNSTLIAIRALEKNREEDSSYSVKHICIEPFEKPWLTTKPVQVERKKLEELDLSLFKTLNTNDILFIDSSHMIRPQGDVLFEYLQILPSLNSGVLVHIHDIFTPRDYPDEWILKEHRLWNEQYLLEAFLTLNNSFEILAAVNFLSHNFKNELASKCPIFASQQNKEPGSFWMRKI
jgi:hypothetical protein